LDALAAIYTSLRAAVTALHGPVVWDHVRALVEREFPDVTVGSYPHVEQRELVIRVRGHDEGLVDAAVARLRSLRSDV